MIASSHGRMPAAVVAAALALGIFLASRDLLGPPSPATLCAVSASLLAAVSVNAVHGGRRRARAARRGSVTRAAGEQGATTDRRPGRRRDVRGSLPALLADIILLTAVALGGASLYQARHRLIATTDISLLAPAEALTVDVSVVQVRGGAGRPPRAVGRVLPGPTAAGTSGLLWLSWPRGGPAPERGSHVRVTGELKLPRAARNPGGFDFAGYLQNRDMRSVLAVRSAELLREPRGAARAAAWVERATRAKLAGETGALLTGLLLGKTTALPEELVASFRRSGTVHVLAVSGLHVGFICAAAYLLLRLLRVPLRPARLLVVPCLVVFISIVGPRPSVIRASVMATAFVVAWSLERRPNSLNTLGLACLVIMLARPGALCDLGFVLSFAATTAIVTIYPALRSLLSALGRLGRLGRLAADSLSISISAQLGVAPVLVATFGTVSSVAPIANLLVVPMAGFAMLSGAMMLASTCVPVVSRLFAGAAHVSLEGAMAVSSALSAHDAASVEMATRLWPAFAMAAAAAAGMAVARRAGALGRRATFASLGVVVLSVATLALWLHLTGPGRGHPRLTVLDVGQGDAILLQIPGRHSVLIDAGTAWGDSLGRDAGRDVVLPCLRRGGISRLDLLVVTHGHGDHFGGVASVLKGCGTREFAMPSASAEHRALVGLAEAALSAGAEVTLAARGDTLLCVRSCTLAVLWPPERGSEGAATENDRSLVIRAGFAGATVLLTGDIETPAERRIVALGETVRADVLKVPHHGSDTSSSAAFTRAVAPRAALVSVGRGNRYGHPDPAVMARLAGSGAEVLRTDLDGAIVVDILSDRILIQGFASGRRVTLDYGKRVGGRGPATATER